MKFSSIEFTCRGCGAPYRFDPATQSLLCEFCSSTQKIQDSDKQILEYDFKTAVKELNTNAPKEIAREITCPKCGAASTLTPFSFGSECGFCGSPLLAELTNEIKPASLLPFKITHKRAKEEFKEWIGSLWFAPNSLKKILDEDGTLEGYYLPHWTFDANTTTEYSGLRGDVYYVSVQREIVTNGSRRTVTSQEARVNWRRASGTVHVNFDDVSVGASHTLSRAILDRLAPWNTALLVPYNNRYITGFEAEEYTIGLDAGFEAAKVKMNQEIVVEIKRDIGGDRQQINKMNTSYYNTTYKSVLFPIWSATFQYGDKKYSYAINAQSGKVAGERPYSRTKILFTVVIALLVVVAGFSIVEDPNFIYTLFE